MRKHSYVRWHAVIVSWLDLIDREITLQGNEIKMKKQIKCGAGQLGVCIHINSSNPRSSSPTLLTPPRPMHVRVHVCVFLWQALDACTASYEPRCLLFLSPVPLHQVSVARVAARFGWLPAPAGGAGSSVCAVCCFACSAQTAPARVSLHKSSMSRAV